MRMKDLILASKYKMQINCILNRLKKLNVTTIVDLHNLPLYGHFCGIDVYQFVEDINKIYKQVILKQMTEEVIKEEEE